jgi:hypothetical protein
MMTVAKIARPVPLEGCLGVVGLAGACLMDFDSGAGLLVSALAVSGELDLSGGGTTTSITGPGFGAADGFGEAEDAGTELVGCILGSIRTLVSVQAQQESSVRD